MDIREATRKDLKQVVAVHRTAFPGFFLTRLGPLFLRQYYDLIATYERRIFLVACEGDRVAGFVAGFVSPADFYSELRGARRRLAIPAAIGVAIQPALLKRLLFNRGRVATMSGQQRDGSCELSSIGVDPKYGGRGVGGALLDAFIVAAGVQRAKTIHLTTDADDNSGVNAFYCRNGFTLVRTFQSGPKRRMNEYAFSLDSEVRGKCRSRPDVL